MNGVTLVLLPVGNQTVTYKDGDSAPVHQTLVYFGLVEDIPLIEKNMLLGYMNQKTASVPPIMARVSGTAILGKDAEPVALTESPEIIKLRNAFLEEPMVSEIMSRSVQFPNYVSHVTGVSHLKYGDYITFNRVALWYGDDRIMMPLTGIQLPNISA